MAGRVIRTALASHRCEELLVDGSKRLRGDGAEVVAIDKSQLAGAPSTTQQIGDHPEMRPLDATPLCARNPEGIAIKAIIERAKQAIGRLD